VKSRKGKNVVRQTTAKSRLARALVAIKEWCRTNRHWPVLVQHAKLSAKLRGHYAYYGRGISGNWTSIASRSQRHGGSGWSGERAQSGSHGHASTRSSHAIPFPAPRSSIATQPRAKLSREEPDAGNLHVRVCEG
jgi:hypothetical protein